LAVRLRGLNAQLLSLPLSHCSSDRSIRTDIGFRWWSEGNRPTPALALGDRIFEK